MSNKTIINGRELTEMSINHMEINGNKTSDNIISSEVTKNTSNVSLTIKIEEQSIETQSNVSSEQAEAYSAISENITTEGVKSENTEKSENINVNSKNWITRFMDMIRGIFSSK